MPSTTDIIFAVFIAGIFSLTGFIIGARQSKNLGYDFSEKILDALRIFSKGEIERVKLNRKTGEFDEILDNPDSTTTSRSAKYTTKMGSRKTTSSPTKG